MHYSEFFQRFGGSARTKHLGSPQNLEKPVFHLPQESGLPKEFIRLCPWEMEFLYAAARRAKIGILEIGRYNGGSTFLLSCANRAVAVHSIDIAPQNDDQLRQFFDQHQVGRNVSLIVGESQNTRYDSIGQIDLLFIDGDHSYEGCAADIKNWYDALVRGGVMVFHDSYTTTENGVQDAILDFLDCKNGEIQVIVSPLIGRSHWRYPHGSMACLQKKC
jgi:predicted O-methyltransferase YrrM